MSNCATTFSLDQIPSSLLQFISHGILPSLTSLINSSLTSGIVPAPFKTATVKPLQKTPALDSADIRNYRPVSLLSFLSKWLECAVYNQLSSYLSENYILDPNQSCFRTGYSTEMAVLTMTSLLGAARALSNSSVLILLDLSSALDTVNHQILLSTLAELGIADSALTWFTSYLRNCTFQVTWNGSFSKPCLLGMAMPQGSVLEPLLFSLYTRSLGSFITSHEFSYHCYADNTQLFLSFLPSSSNNHVEMHISECFGDIFTWTAVHHLKLILSKTELLFITGKDCPHMSWYCLQRWWGTWV